MPRSLKIIQDYIKKNYYFFNSSNFKINFLGNKTLYEKFLFYIFN